MTNDPASSTRPPVGRIAGLLALGGYLALYRLGRTYGATPTERRTSLPGDELVPEPQVVATHAATIAAPPDRVWPWLAQVGWHRGGWYTPRWVDALLFPDNWPSADQILDEYQDLAVGDFVPDGSPETECGFVVRAVDPPAQLVLHSSTHLPLSWRQNGTARIDWTWVFALRPVDSGRGTRLVFRWRARTAPWWLTVGAHLFIVPADFVMSRGMLKGLALRGATPRAGAGGKVGAGECWAGTWRALRLTSVRARRPTTILSRPGRPTA